MIVSVQVTADHLSVEDDAGQTMTLDWSLLEDALAYAKGLRIQRSRGHAAFRRYICGLEAKWDAEPEIAGNRSSVNLAEAL